MLHHVPQFLWPDESVPIVKIGREDPGRAPTLRQVDEHDTAEPGPIRQREQKSAARSKYPGNLRQHPRRRVHVLEHFGTDHRLERFGGEREPFAAGHGEPAGVRLPGGTNSRS